MDAPQPERGPGLGTLAAFLGMVLVWGSSFLSIKLSLTGLSPGQVATGRLLVGALVLGGFAAVRRRPLPREPRLWLHLTVVGVFLCVVPFLLFAWAGEFLPSGLSAILNATTPLWTVLVTSVAIRSSRLSAWQLVGVGVGAVGVAVVVGIWRLVADPAFHASLPAQLACLGATLCYGIGFAWLRRFVTGRHPYDGVTTAAVQVGTAALLSLAISPVTARGAIHVTPTILAAMLVLGGLGTGLAYAWNMRVVEQWGPVRASAVTYLVPVVAIALGIAVLGESLSWNQPLGAAVIVLGVLLVQRAPLRSASRAAATSPTAER